MRGLLLALIGASLFTATACGPGEAGDECNSLAATSDDCVDGTICAASDSDVLDDSDPNPDTAFCRTVCDTAGDCSGDLECRNVIGSTLSACQPPLD